MPKAGKINPPRADHRQEARCHAAGRLAAFSALSTLCLRKVGRLTPASASEGLVWTQPTGVLRPCLPLSLSGGAGIDLAAWLQMPGTLCRMER